MNGPDGAEHFQAGRKWKRVPGKSWERAPGKSWKWAPGRSWKTRLEDPGNEFPGRSWKPVLEDATGRSWKRIPWKILETGQLEDDGISSPWDSQELELPVPGN